MTYQPRIGDVIKLYYSWHGVVLNIFTSQTNRTILQVQTARNVFRGHPPEFIELEGAAAAITPAARADLEAEIVYWRRMRERGLKQMLEGIREEGSGEGK